MPGQAASGPASEIGRSLSLLVERGLPIITPCFAPHSCWGRPARKGRSTTSVVRMDRAIVAGLSSIGSVQRISISIVLIAGQLAVLCAAPAYICTSPDGTQHVEWGECDGHGIAGVAQSGFGGQPTPELPRTVGGRQISQPPCHCEHQPLFDGVQLLSRFEREVPGPVSIALIGTSVWRPEFAAPGSSRRVVVERGHAPLADRLPICLRC
jgi:hypothetical protein